MHQSFDTDRYAFMGSEPSTNVKGGVKVNHCGGAKLDQPD